VELLAEGLGLVVGLALGDAIRVCAIPPELGIGLARVTDSVLTALVVRAAALVVRPAALVVRPAALVARTAAAEADAQGDRCEWRCAASAGATAAADSRNNAAAVTRAVCKARSSATGTGLLPMSTMLRR
jgi:hypothetical protein